MWVWWVENDPRLSSALRALLDGRQPDGLAVSVISCWEVAKLVEVGRLTLPLPVREWIDSALNLPDVRILELTPGIAVASTQLPGVFHRDPADQILVATARELGIPLVTLDERIRAYPHVATLP